MVRQENSYYGFGLSLANSPVAPLTDNNKNLYNGGSEWQNDYGNLPDLQQTFYRNYDAALGRWIAVDPVAESAESMSVYQYAGNNPIMMNDPLGDKLPAEGSGITQDWTTNATPYVPHHSIYGSGIDPTILQAGEMYASGNGYGDYSALWVNIFKAAGYNVDKNGIATNSNADPKSSVDYYVDADGKLIAKSSYDGGPGGVRYHGVTVTGTDHGKPAYIVNDEISYDEVGVRRLTANAQKWLVDYHGFQQSVSNGVSKAWNSEFMRSVIPDMISVNVNYSIVFFGGDGYSHEAHWVTRGPDAGPYSSWTHSEKRVGLFFDLSGGVSASYYRGFINQIKYSDYLGAAKEMGGKFLGGLSLSISHDGYTTTWGTVGMSAGLSAGGYVGTSTTYPLFK